MKQILMLLGFKFYNRYTFLSLQGLVEAYQNALPYLEFHGPTNFEQVLNKAVSLATEMDVLEGSAYVNLIILTDGKISGFVTQSHDIFRFQCFLGKNCICK